MKTKLIFTLLLSLPIFANAQSVSSDCKPGTVASAWDLKNQSGEPKGIYVIVRYPTSPVLEKAYTINYVADLKRGVGKIVQAWALRPDMYGKEAVSVTARFSNLNLEKIYQTAKNQKVCVYSVNGRYAIRFLGNQYP